MPKLSTFILLLITSVSAFAVGPLIETELARVNSITLSNRARLLEVRYVDFVHWYRARIELKIKKVDRGAFEVAIEAGRLPDGYELTVYQNDPNYSPTIVLRDLFSLEKINGFRETVVNGLSYEIPLEKEIVTFQKAGLNTDEPLLKRELSSTKMPYRLPRSVPVRIKPIVLKIGVSKEELARRNYRDVADVDALDISFQISPSNVEDLARYFGNAYSETLMKERLLGFLKKNEKSKWINLKAILQGWAGEWTNKFPMEYAVQHGLAHATDTCHGTARLFFKSELASGAWNGSNALSEWLLINSYKRMANGAVPVFGDYLYIPDTHSVRFVLQDPGSGRWIGWSSWSGQTTPYRIWWVDQDYLPSWMPTPGAKHEYENQFDIYRPVTNF